MTASGEEFNERHSLVAELMSRVIPSESLEIDKHIQKVKEVYDESMFQLSELVEKHYARRDVTSVILVDLQKLSSDLRSTRDVSTQRAGLGAQVQVTSLEAKRESVEKELRQISDLISTVEELMEFQECHRDSKTAVLHKLHSEAVKNVLKAGQILEKFSSKIPKNLSKHIRIDYKLQLHLTFDSIRNLWFELFKFRYPSTVDTYEDTILIEMCFLPQFEILTVENICQMLSDLNISSDLFEQFREIFVKFVILPLFRIKTISLEITDFDCGDKVTFSHKNGHDNLSSLPVQITRAVTIVSELFSPFEIGKSFLSEFGCHVWSAVVKEFQTLLSQREDDFSEALRSDWIKFEEDLVNLKMIKLENKALGGLLSTTDAGFGEKRQEKVLFDTRELFKKDLFNTKTVSIQINERKLTDYIPQNVDESDLQSRVYLSNYPLNQSEMNYLKENPFIFPSCSVSLFTIDFVQKCHELMLEATQNRTQYAFDVMKTVRLMLQLFYSLVPYIHKTQIRSVPRSTAIFHNSCMYVSHHLITLGFQYRASMPEPLNSEICTFIDFVPIIRQLGEEAWMEMVNKQKCEVKELLAPLNQSISGLSLQEKGDSVQKSFISLTTHLHQLSKTWKEVLPIYFSRGSVGLILDVAFEICVNSVFYLTDISATDAAKAANLFTLLRDRSVPLFHLSGAAQSEIIGDACETWFRLNELILLLDASLKQIRERWDGGKGPFGVHFKAGEVKNFIRGSFKTSEKRSELLAIIN